MQFSLGIALCLSRLAALAPAAGLDAESAKQVLDAKWQKLRPPSPAERNVLFRNVALVSAVGTSYIFHVTALIRDYEARLSSQPLLRANLSSLPEASPRDPADQADLGGEPGGFGGGLGRATEAVFEIGADRPRRGIGKGASMRERFVAAKGVIEAADGDGVSHAGGGQGLEAK